MESVLLVILAVPLLLLAYIALRPPTFPDTPGPPLRDYLPGGLINEILKDRRKYLDVILRLVDKHGDVFQAWIGVRHFLFTANAEDIVQITTSRTDFDRLDSVVAAFDSISPGSLFTMPREKHLAARKILRNALHHSMMRDFHPAMLDAVAELVGDLKKLAATTPSDQPSPVFDATEMLSAVTFRVILNVAFGAELDRDTRIQFAKNIDAMTKEMFADVMYYPMRQMLTPFGVRDGLLKRRDFLHAVLRSIIQKRMSESEEQKSNRPKDFLDAIVEVEGDNVPAIVSQTVFVASAGSHTTNIVMSWCLYHLNNNPEVADEVRAELDSLGKSPEQPFTFEDVEGMVYLKKVWRETLRLTPATGFTTRKAVREVTLKGSGKKLSKNSRVAALYLRRQLDERYWTQPKKFMPERWGTPDKPGEGDTAPAGFYLPFSLGTRNCVGQMLADYEGVLVLAELLRHFKFSLACAPSEVISTSGVVQAGRYSSKQDGVLDMGIPMRVELR